MEIVIAYSTDENYVKYVCVSVTSLLRHISSENTYRIIVLNDDISDKSQKIIASTGYGYDNVTFEFVNVKESFPQNMFVGWLSIAAYYRFALLDLFPEIDKILYLDSDTIILTDVAELFKTDITGYYLAAVRDLGISYTYMSDNDGLKEYLDDVLKLKVPTDYVNTGILLLNLKELRKDYNTKKLIEMAIYRAYRFVDQDIINIIA